VLGVHRDDLAGPSRPQHQRTTRHQGLLIGQRQTRTAGQRGQRGFEPERPDQGVEHHVSLGVLHQPGSGVGAAVGDVADMLCSSRVGDRNVGHAGLGALTGEQFGITASGCEAYDRETIRVGSDHLQRLGADRPGAAQDQYAQAGGRAHRTHCAAPMVVTRAAGPRGYPI
jgi:hypothetical protein